MKTMPGKRSKISKRKKDTRKRDFTSPGAGTRTSYSKGTDKFKVPAFDMKLWPLPNVRIKCT